MAFVATGADGVSTLWVSALESAQPAEVSGSEGARSPFWSPDSRWIAFFSRGRLTKVEPGGTGVHAICDGPAINTRGGTWGPGDVILFSSSVVGPLARCPASGGTLSMVTSMPSDMAGEAHRYPQFLPDGKRFLYLASWTNQQRGGVYLGSLDGGDPTLVSSEIRSRAVLASGHLLFLRGGTVYAQPFDAARGEVTGEARALLRNEITWDWRFGDMPLSASQTGILVYQSRMAYNSQLVWYDRSGRELGIAGSPGLSAPALSPEGRRVAAAFDSAGSGQQNLWVHDLTRNIATQLTRDGIDTAHNWSPDGRWLAYSAVRTGNGLYRRLADGSGREETLLESPAHLLINDYSRDGRRLLYMDFSSGAPELRSYDFETSRNELVDVGAEGSYSPDGKWIAYVGLAGVLLVRSAGEGGARVQISSGLGSQARWRADGQEIFYMGIDKKMMAVPLTIRDGVLEPGNPVELFQTRIIQPRLVLFQYDVTPDGQRFLINSLPREDAAAPLTLLVNWTEELKR